MLELLAELWPLVVVFFSLILWGVLSLIGIIKEEFKK